MCATPVLRWFYTRLPAAWRCLFLLSGSYSWGLTSPTRYAVVSFLWTYYISHCIHFSDTLPMSQSIRRYYSSSGASLSKSSRSPISWFAKTLIRGVCLPTVFQVVDSFHFLTCSFRDQLMQPIRLHQLMTCRYTGNAAPFQEVWNALSNDTLPIIQGIVVV